MEVVKCVEIISNMTDLNTTYQNGVQMLFNQGLSSTEVATQLRSSIKDFCGAYPPFETCSKDAIGEEGCKPLSYKILANVNSVVCDPKFRDAVEKDGKCYAELDQKKNISAKCAAEAEKLLMTDDPFEDFPSGMCRGVTEVLGCVEEGLKEECGIELLGYLRKLTFKVLGAVFGDVCESMGEKQ